MFKFKEPLAKHPYHQWGLKVQGAADTDPVIFARSLAATVTECMKEKFGITVNAEVTEITIGGLFNSKTHPGVSFSFADHSNWAGFLVGCNKVAGMVAVDVVQVGTPSSGMQRLNSAESKGMFSLTGALQKAFTDQSAVEEESMCYSALLQCIQDCFEVF